MNEVQECILEIYNEVKSICERYGIPFYAIGGTCIGAVRHEGFIPWDDDLDIAVPVEYYDFLRQILKNKLPSYLKVYEGDQHPHYSECFMKIIDERTTFIGEFQYRYPDSWTGIWIDIMPLSGVPEKGIKRNIFCMEVQKNICLNYYRRCNDVDDEMGIRFLKEKRIVKKIIDRRVPNNYYLLKQQELLTKYPLRGSKYTGYVWSENLPKLIFPSEWFSNAVTVPFEGTEMYIPQGYHDYLTQQFGDYMIIPPHDEQEIHNGFIDVNRSYISYKDDIKMRKRLLEEKQNGKKQ